MLKKLQNTACMSIRGSHPRAFSFAEVMFAVVILGIGFIMVAAVFPVAIRQTQSTGEENTATNAARTAAAAIANMQLIANNLTYYSSATSSELTSYPCEGVQTTPVFPPTVKNYILPDAVNMPLPGTPPQVAVAPPAVVVPFTGLRWTQLQSNIVSSTDPRYSYVAFYKRENNSAVAELIVVAVANRNRPNYDSSTAATSDITGSTSTQTVTTPATLTIANLGTGNNSTAYTKIVPDMIQISPGILVNPDSSKIASPEGGSITIPIGTLPDPSIRNQNPKPWGRYYTLGRCLTQMSAGAVITQFEINPGDSMYLTPGTNGLWGTAGMKFDPPLAGDSCTLTQPSTLQPSVAYIQSLTSTPANPSGQITLTVNASQTSLSAPLAAAQGAFVIVADDCPFDFSIPGNDFSASAYSIPPNTANYQVGKLNGRIFRLGAPIVQRLDGFPEPPGTFQLDPAYGMQPAVLNSGSPDAFPNPNTPTYATTGTKPPAITARCYIIGAGKDTTGNPAGPAQDIGVFATYIQVQ